MAWLTGWTYRKAIVIAHTADGAQTNYQMKLLVGESSGASGEDVDCGGLVASDFDDLRFTTSDGTTLCDYWIESLSGSTPNQLATVWIEIPSIAAHPDDTTIYMYYGGTQTAVSNGDNTFLFFDDFNDASIDTAKWTISGSPTEASGVLSTNGSNTVTGKTAVGTNRACRYYAKGNTTNVYAAQSGFYGDANNYLLYWIISTGAQTFTANTNGAGTYNQTSTGIARDTSYHIFEILRDSTTSVKYNINEGAVEVTRTTNIPTDNEVIYFAGNSTNGCVVDWVFIRNYTVNEPTWSSFGSVQTAYERTASVIIGAVASATRIFGAIRSASIIAGVVSTASRVLAFTRSASIIAGAVASATRVLGNTRTASIVAGATVTASRTWAASRADSVIIGVAVTASRLAGIARAASTVIGAVVTATRQAGYIRTASVIIGVAVTASRLAAFIRSASVAAGVVASATVELFHGAVNTIVNAAIAIGAVVTASKALGFTRSASIVVGVVATGLRTIAEQILRIYTGLITRQLTITSSIARQLTLTPSCSRELTLTSSITRK